MRLTLLALLLAVSQVSQSPTISGEVRDPSGALVAAAQVTLASPQLGSQRLVLTNAVGQFRFTEVLSGGYEISVSRQGFRTATRRVQVAASNVITSIPLEVGSLSETVTIRASFVPDTGRPRFTPAVEPQTPEELLEAARSAYQEGRFVEADLLRTRGLETLRAIEAQTLAPAQTADAVTRIGGQILEPRKLRDVRPVYPAQAIAAGVEGTVVIEAVIDKYGTVKDARVVRSVPGLDESALGAVRLWAFSPTKLNGAPIEVTMTASVNFGR